MIGNRHLLTAAAIMLLITLAGLGVSYGLWSEWLYIEGTVETGEVEVVWMQPWCYEDGAGKDWVADVTAYIDPVDPDILRFEITNGFPYYFAGCQYEYEVLGTIPVHVEYINFFPGPNLTGCVVQYQPTAGGFLATCNELVIWFSDGLGTQLHPGDTNGGSLHVTVQQAADELASYEFAIEFQFNQFNESRFPPQP